MATYTLDEAFEDMFGSEDDLPRPLEDTTDVENMPETKLVNIMVTAERLLSSIQEDTDLPSWISTKLKSIESDLDHIANHFEMFEN